MRRSIDSIQKFDESNKFGEEDCFQVHAGEARQIQIQIRIQIQRTNTNLVKRDIYRYTRVKQDNAALTARIHMLEEHIRELEVLYLYLV